MATITNVNTGTVDNDNTGDTLRAAFTKINTNTQNINTQITNTFANLNAGISVNETTDVTSILSNAVAIASATTNGFRIDNLPSTNPLVSGILYEDNNVIKKSTGTHNSFIKPITANYTLILADKGYYLKINSSSPVIITIPLNSSVAFKEGDVIEWQHFGIGNVSFKGVTGVTVNNRAETGTDESLFYSYGKNSFGYLQYQGSNTWVAINTKSKENFVSSYTLYTSRTTDATSGVFTLYKNSTWVFETTGLYNGATTKLQYRAVGDSVWVDVTYSEIYDVNKLTLYCSQDFEMRYVQTNSNTATSITAKLTRISEI
jgi:hypothetical protein